MDNTFWTPELLKEVLRGEWLVEPSEEWQPAQVQVRAVKRVNPRFSGNMINIIRKPAEIQRAYDEISAGNKKGGCIVIRNALVESAGVLKELGIPVMATPRGGALKRMAIFRREKHNGPVICVTGTAGKTSVRGMIYETASSHFKTIQNRGNWNFRDHVFENMASMPKDTECAVLEIGLGQKNVRLGDVVAVLKPSISVVTSIGIGHMDAIGSTSEVEDELESAFKAKMQVVDHMTDDSFAVVPGDITMHQEVISILKNKVSSYKTVGDQPQDSVRMLEREWKDGKNRLRVESDGTQYSYDLAAPGEHMAKNSLLAICVAEKLGINMKKTLVALEKFTPRSGRAKLIELESQSGKKVVIFDDSRNSTPLSLASSLVTFEEVAKDKKKVAILGEVGEFHVGKDMEGFHRNLAKEIKEKEFNRVLVMGESMKYFVDENDDALYFETFEELCKEFIDGIDDDCHVLIKASAHMKFQKLAAMIAESSEFNRLGS